MVREQAQAISCKNQLRQVVMANITYRTDNEGTYPQVYWNDPTWSTWSNWGYSKPTIGHWQQVLEEYTNTFKVFNCPVSAKLYPKAAVLDQDTGPIKRGAAPGGGSPGWPVCTMAINSQNFARAGSWAATATRPSGPFTDGKIQSMISLNNSTFGGNATLSRCPVYFDGVWQNDGVNHQSKTVWNGAYWPHRGTKSNMAFADGHTEIRPYADVVSFATNTTILQIAE
jgi:prepilin-type processing-associated H-X9-DG protein